MVLVPGPHILNGAIDLARTRIALGIARLAYAGVIVLLICAGGLFGFTAVGANPAIAGSSPPVPLVIDVIAAGFAVASFGTFFSMPWRLLALPITVGMVAHAARWALISVAGGSAPSGALVACMLVSVLATPVVDRLHLPFAAVAFSAVVSLMPGFFLFDAATGLVELVSIGPTAPAALLTSIAANGATAFLIIMAMTFGLILPRMLFERVLPAPARNAAWTFYAPHRCSRLARSPAVSDANRAAGPVNRRSIHDCSSDQIVPARNATCNKGGPGQKTRLDRRRRFRRHRGSTGAQASRRRNNAGRPA